MLVLSTVFPSIDVKVIALGFGAAIVAGAVGVGVRVVVSGPFGPRRWVPSPDEPPKQTWRMPPSALLEPAPSSRSRRIVTSSLAVALVVTLALLLVNTIQLALGH